MSSYGPGERELLETRSAALYDDLVTAGGLSVDDPRLADESPERPAFDLLVELGLVRLDALAATWVPEDPHTVQTRVVSPLTTRGVDLIEESARWARAFEGLRHSWRRAPASPARGEITRHHEAAIGPFIAALVAEVEEEILTAQPQVGRDAQSLAAAVLRDTAALERGIRMRTLYQHSARRSAVTHDYVAAVTSRGAEVRTLDEFFNRMIVLDRRVAVIPGEDLSVAIAVREPGVVAYLADVFDRAWERGRPFADTARPLLREIAAEQRAMTIRMLIQGHADSVSAKRLGVSPRTYAAYVADLKDEHDVTTRFQLGYALGRQQVSGEEGAGPPTAP